VLTIRDFIVAWAKNQRLRNADAELAGYWSTRFQLLAEALGLPHWESVPTPLPRCMPEIVRLADTSLDYWEGLLEEYAYLKDEKKIHSAHRPWIKTAAVALRRRYMDFAENLFLHYRPSLRGANTTLAQLIERGLPPHEPDRGDFI
jgi:hypothetical protein